MDTGLLIMFAIKRSPNKGDRILFIKKQILKRGGYMAVIHRFTGKPIGKSSYPFQRDARGRDVFFPNGRFGKGYIVKNPKLKKQISLLSSGNNWVLIISLVLWRLVGRSGHSALGLVFLGILVLSVITYMMAVRFLVSGLPLADTRFQNRFGNARVFSKTGLWTLFAVLVLAFLIFLSLAVMGWDVQSAKGPLVLMGILLSAILF